MVRILHMGAKELDLNKPINVTGTDINKPNFGSGCLYGSTLIRLPGDVTHSSWKNFTAGDYISKDVTYGISFKLHRNAKILEIANLNDYIEIMKTYKCKHEYRDEYCLDFEKISKDYDAFHLTLDAFWDMRLPWYGVIYETMHELKYDNFYSYDAETWIIFNLNAINKGSILNHNNICSFYNYDEDDDY